MSGWLLSRSHVLRVWRWRWFALTNTEFIVCKDEDWHKPKRCINLVRCSKVSLGDAGTTMKENSFGIYVGDLLELLVAASPEERKCWMDQIKRAVRRVQKPMQDVREISIGSSCSDVSTAASPQVSLRSWGISSDGRSFTSASAGADSFGSESELCRRLLTSLDVSARCRAATELGSSHGAWYLVASSAVALMQSLQSDAYPAVRAAAAAAIGKLKHSAFSSPSLDAAGAFADYLEALMAVLVGALERDADVDVRVAAAEALGHIGPAAAVVASASLAFAVVTDNAPAVRQAAALAIGRVGLQAFPGGDTVLLGRLSADRCSEVRLAVIDGLTLLGPTSLGKSVVKLEQALHQERHEVVRARIADALGKVQHSACLVSAEVLGFGVPDARQLSRESSTEIVSRASSTEILD